MSIGVYKIENSVDGRLYIGSAAVSFESRWAKHLSSLKANKHSNRFLQNAWNKYGEKSFVFSILEEVQDAGDCVPCEQKHIDSLWNSGVLYNLCQTAGSTLGVKYTDESKKLLSELAVERCREPGRVEKMSELARVSARKPETKKKMSDAQKLRFSNPEEISKYSEIKRRDNLSDETRKKMSESQRARLTDDIKRELISRLRSGIDTEEKKKAAVDKLRQTMKAPETKKRMSDSQKKRMNSVSGGIAASFARRKKNPDGSIRIFNIKGPNGVVYTDIQNLASFAKEHGLDNGSLSSLFSGKAKSHKGWTVFVE